ncbi:hypothetical protein [Candidatus Odyssella acanthamoebae]|uniref:hypothetical protein n=1 Tax=Candidatus Odyssella acanthamoebae TaxID=91604 RepID=UPI0012EC67F7|nr:hypothetical protein [Candidatus Paracaedibacter acanthamoebae]
MMPISMCSSHTKQVAVTETMTGTLYAHIITKRTTQENGKTVQNAKMISSWKIMLISQPMTLTLRS